jgi:Na+/melibiose symporter-like transporter
MFAAALPLGLTFYLLFNPLVSGDLGLLIWLIVFTNLARTAMTLYYVPHVALGAEMTDDYDERSSVVSYRTFMSSLGYLLAIFIGFGVFFTASPEFPNGQLNAAAYPPMALSVAVLMVVVILWSAFGTRHLIPSLPKAGAGASLRPLAAIRRMMTDVALAVRSRSFRWLFLGVLILFVIIGVDAALNIYMYTYFWELSGAQIALLAPMYWLGVMAGTLFSPWLQRRFGKKTMLLFGTGSWAFWQMLPVVLRLLDWFPENDALLLVPLLAAMRVFQGLCAVQSNVAYGSMMADVVDEHELNTGKRQEGIFFAASSFSAKAPAGLGTIIAGFGLELIEWPTGTHIRTAADVAPETIVHLGIMFGPFVAGFGLVCVWCYTHYDLSRERHDEISRELRRRRAAAAPS